MLNPKITVKQFRSKLFFELEKSQLSIKHPTCVSFRVHLQLTKINDTMM